MSNFSTHIMNSSGLINKLLTTYLAPAPGVKTHFLHIPCTSASLLVWKVALSQAEFDNI
jgi:hypothetical protein